MALEKLQFLEEAKYSAKSLKKYHSNIKITLATDLNIQCPRIFDNIKYLNSGIHPKKNKVEAIKETPYESTLYIDADTKIKGDLSCLFNKLNHFDLCMANAPLVDYQGEKYLLKSLRKEGSFNTGLMLFNKSGIINQLLTEWYTKTYEQNDKDLTAEPGKLGDQVIFNSIFPRYIGRINFGVLDNSVYNVRPIMYPTIKEKKLENLVKILHMHGLHKSRISIKFLDYIRYLKQKCKK